MQSMKKINLPKTQNVELAETQLPDPIDNSLGDILELLHVMRSHLCELERFASNTQLISVPGYPADGAQNVPIPTLWTLKESTGIDALRQAARDLLGRYFTVNREVWVAEQPFESATPENEVCRAIGKQMHHWYECLKRCVLLDLRLYASGDCIDPTFQQMWVEGMTRMAAGEPIATEYMRQHWGLYSAE